MLFQREGPSGMLQQGGRRSELADGAARIGIDPQGAAEGEGLDLLRAGVFDDDFSSTDTISVLLRPGVYHMQPGRSAGRGGETGERFRIEVLAGRSRADHHVELRMAQIVFTGR